MDWDPQVLREAEDLLNGGKPSGVRLDAMWERMQSQLPQAHKPARAWWWGGLLSMAGVAAALWLMPRETFQARGTPTDAPAWLQASCGEKATPCHVGQAVYAQVQGVRRGYVTVVLAGPSRVLLARNVAVEPQAPAVALPTKVIPDAEDVARGVALELWWFDAPPTDAEQDALLEQTQNRPADQLVLRVVP